ncbi:diaminopimelate epimerase [Chromohalobacter nigrandesensis]|uniref:diaminopimelate epimerase n=1 Tax=Chromohalobacter nigrandesensis TaxID=119863 RepID=UPI001FF18E40|nr:diaminopimelate epimerase [Chromohalobacter nigrandesensis]MCK0744605.1 diaminopimelate epimerase [Chromohalobacter nigrandesensis]
MLLHFTKMHGLGNDFMVVDLVTQRARLDTERIQQLANRHLGIGFDQLLLVEPPRDPEMDFRYRIFNADGHEVENCGNGARCFARFVRGAGLTHKREIRVETQAGPLTLRVEEDERVRVNMGVPRFAPEAVPFDAPTDAPTHTLEVDDTRWEIGVVSMGNPHAVLVVDDADSAPVAHLGPLIERHVRFPRRVNVGFLQVVSRHEARLRVFERGSGETLACGTGACAAVATGIRRGLFESPVDVHLPGGTLTVEWPAEDAPMVMIGPATSVFEGRIALP